MRNKDEFKQNKIKHVVLQIVAEDGLAGLSFAKIASRAGVSSGTPYVYYKDKTDMLSKIYIEVKELLDDGLQEAISKGTTIKEQLYFGVFHFAERYVEYPLESNYAYSISYSPEYITEKAMQQSLFLTKPLFDLYEKAIKDNILLVDDIEQLNALLFAPMATLLKQGEGADLEKIKKVVLLSVDAVIKS